MQILFHFDIVFALASVRNEPSVDDVSRELCCSVVLATSLAWLTASLKSSGAIINVTVVVPPLPFFAVTSQKVFCEKCAFWIN